MAAAHTGTALASNGIDLVDEDDGRGVLLRLVEQIAHTGCAKTDEHLDEVGARHRIERHTRLAGDRSRQQRLTGSRRAIQQHASRNTGTQRLVFGGILQKVLDLLDFGQSLVLAGHVGKPGARGLTFQQLAVVLLAAHAEHVAGAHAAHQEPCEGEEDDERQNRLDQVGHHAAGLDVGAPPLGWIRFLHGLDDILTLRERVVELHALAVVVHLAGVRIALGEVALQLQRDLLLVVHDLGVVHLTVVQQFQTVLGVDDLRAHAGEHLEHGDDEDDDYRAPQPRGLPERLIAAIGLIRLAAPAVLVHVLAERVVEGIAVVVRLPRSLRNAHACSP